MNPVAVLRHVDKRDTPEVVVDEDRREVRLDTMPSPLLRDTEWEVEQVRLGHNETIKGSAVEWKVR